MRHCSKRRLRVDRLESRCLLSMGPTIGNEFRVNDFTQGQQFDVTLANDDAGDFVAVWTSGGQDGSSNGVFGQLFHADGSVAVDEFPLTTLTTGDQDQPSVAMDATTGRFVAAWRDIGTNIRFRSFAADGSPDGTSFVVNSTTGGSRSSPVTAFAADRWVAAWASDGQDGSGQGVYARVFSYPDVPLGAEFRVNQTTAGNQQAPAVAMDADGDFSVTWASSAQDGDGDGVYLRRFDRDGAALSSEQPVNLTTAGEQSLPAIAVDSAGDIVVAWQSLDQDGELYGVYARRYAANGTPSSAEIPVNTTTESSQWFSSVGIDDGGGFVVTWWSLEQDGSQGGIYAQPFHADGSPLGTEFLVNTVTSDSQQTPSIAVNSDGAFVIAWESLSQDGSLLGVYAQRFDALPTITSGGVTVARAPGPQAPYVVPTGSGEQLRSVDNARPNQIRISFNKPVIATANDLAVTGTRIANYPVSGFSYDPITRTAVWTLTPFIETDQITLALSDAVHDAFGTTLDGEWTNPSGLTATDGSDYAGDGCAGGAWLFRINVLSGDSNRDNVVTGADYTLWANGFDNGLGPPDQTIAQGDFNGDGHSTGADYTLWANHFGIDYRQLDDVSGASAESIFPVNSAPTLGPVGVTDRHVSWDVSCADDRPRVQSTAESDLSPVAVRYSRSVSRDDLLVSSKRLIVGVAGVD